ncbi:hypothetical protein ACOMHN_056266 [Nucella lapillus]
MNMTTSLNNLALLSFTPNITTPLPILNISSGDNRTDLSSLLPTTTTTIPTTTVIPLLLQELTTSLTDHLLSNVSMWTSDGNESAGTGVDRGPLPAYTTAHNVLVTTVCGLGILLNVLNLLVLTERCLKESPYTYLTAMALLCLASLTMSFLQNVCMQSFRNNYYCFVYTFHVYFPCVNICSNSTMWLIVTLTIERFLFIKHPLWARAKCDRRSAKIKICVVILLMVILNIPRFFFYKVVPHKEKGPGYYTYDDTFRLSKAIIVTSWLYSILIQGPDGAKE